jgi:hypothetical protein
MRNPATGFSAPLMKRLMALLAAGVRLIMAISCKKGGAMNRYKPFFANPVP